MEQPSNTVSEIPANSSIPVILEEKENWFIKFIKSCTKCFNIIKNYLALFMIFIIIGVSLGFYVAKIIYNWRMTEIITIGGFVHENKVYDTKERIIQPPVK